MSRLTAIRQKFAELPDIFDRLSGREKLLIVALVLSFLATLAVAISILVNISLNGLKDRVETKRRSLDQIVSMKDRFTQAKLAAEKAQGEMKENKTENLTKAIGNLAEEIGLEITQIQGSKGAVDKKAKLQEEVVKVELKRVDLATLWQFMERIEQQNKAFYVSNIGLKRRYDNKDQIEATINISTLIPLEEEG